MMNNPNLPEDKILDISINIFSALEYMHNSGKHGYMHRDLKPSNIFKSGDIFKLGDLGSSWMIMSDATKTMGVHGTYQYMSPEIIFGKKIHSFATDIWSACFIIY